MKIPGFRPERLTLLLLLLALSTLFLRNVDKGYFYRPAIGLNNLTARNLIMAENLSPDHGFRLFLGQIPGSGGAPTYELYGRFPVGGYTLIKLAMLPFGNDLSAKILAARMLMLLLFSGAALLAFHSLARITSHRWVALAATLAAFSSYYMLLYSNTVSTECSMDLFAVMLVFHGMVVFVQEGRFRQLLAKTFVALLLGWHVYAFLLPFLILGLAREAVRAWKDGTAPWLRVRSAGAALLRSRYMALGLAALLFGMAVLSFNFANEYAAEYAAFGGETAVSELPSFRSMLRRTGLNQAFQAHDWWLRFLRKEFFRVFVASVPLALADWGAWLLKGYPPFHFSAPVLSGPETWVYVLSLLLAMAACTAAVRLAWPLLAGRSRILAATLALSGFCWALPMRYNAFGHPHEAMYYVGVPLVFYSLLLLYVHKRWGRGPVVGLAVAALLAFVVSAFRMDGRWPPDARAVEIQRTALSELGTIRETTRGKVVLILGSVKPEWSWQSTYLTHEWGYYLAGSVLTRSGDVEAAARTADFIVTLDRVESHSLLTPGNERVFLYDSAGIDDLVELYRATYQRVASGEPAARSDFDVYLDDGALFHLKEPCVPEDVGMGTWDTGRNHGYKISVQVVPKDLKDLSRWRRSHGFHPISISFRISVQVVPEDLKDLPRWGRSRGFHPINLPFQLGGVLFEGKCMAIVSLPDYPISGIRTGHWRPKALRPADRKGYMGWEVEIGSLRRPGPQTP